MMAMSTTKTNDTKPRLGKDEVDILEGEFKKNPKPTTQIKRGFAEDMGVDLARINVSPRENWFQNRRAKRKQERKQEIYEARQAQESVGLSDTATTSSPDHFHGTSYFGDGQPPPPSSSFPLISRLPPSAVDLYKPQYSNPPATSMESLQRSMDAAAQASHPDFHDDFLEDDDPMPVFGDAMIHRGSEDRARFPAPDTLVTQFDPQGYAFPSTFTDDLYTSPPSTHDLRASPIDTTHQTATPYIYSTSSNSESNGSQAMATFPSQLLPPPGHDHLPSLTNDSGDSQSPEESSESHLPLDFKYEVTESDHCEVSPPAPSIPFKSSAPMDIASRRKKVHVKPAALVSETLRSRPSLGPRTASHAADGFRRAVDSPIGSPMRRIVSAGGNRSAVISGRIYKSGIESAQRSPINLGGFVDAGAFMERNFHNMRHPPSMSTLSSLNSSLAPPTPMSPREREMTLSKRDGSRSTASPHDEGSMNFGFDAGVPGRFTTMDGDDQNLASPPETPQAQMVLHGNGWPSAVDYQDKQWAYEVPDEPLYTPANDGFPVELQMPQPTYIANMSQPVTPALGQFNPTLIFGHESPPFKHESPRYTLSTQSSAEYAYPDSQGHFPLAMLTSAMTKQKTFQFSNTTAADFSGK
ncbi:hypothetical protein BJ875DRAFT_379724 [Amylocarpus encephaloides]|uniref:Homeobox domain-containing protein n=1 Tax=Amylocarpus encephaloides TaxID=45428 RepID=A0A9P8C492_9HELO|nr:hypothetical protein BJ875DRAFT_379724 [Amylocarpus encephaloides]